MAWYRLVLSVYYCTWTIYVNVTIIAETAEHAQAVDTRPSFSSHTAWVRGYSQKWKNSKIREYLPCEVDTRCMYGRAVVLTVKLSIQHSWSREQLGFCLAVEHSMTKSIECNPPTSTSCPPDINHVISILSPSTFLWLICFCVLLWKQTHYGQKSNKIYWTHFVW